MSPIILRRRGVSRSLTSAHRPLLTPGCGSDCPPGVAVEIQDWQSKCYMATVYVDGRHYNLPKPNMQNLPADGYPTRNAALAGVTALLAANGHTVTLSPEVERYIPATPSTLSAYPHVASDVSFDRCVYDEATSRIVTVGDEAPLTLLDWEHDAGRNPLVQALPGEPAVHPLCRWHVIVPPAVRSYQADHNHSKWQPEPYPRQWLAWLISEYRKYGVNS